MHKVLIVLAFFLGLLGGYFLDHEPTPPMEKKEAPKKINILSEKNSPNSESSIAYADSIENETAQLMKFLSADTPKTRFQFFQEFNKLERLSSDSIENILLTLDDTQLELKGQLTWFFAGKFPDQAFLLMDKSMSSNNMALARNLLSNLSTNHPEKVFNWLQTNENDFAILFPVEEQQLNQKMHLYQTLAIFPDWKWIAYEKGMEMVKGSVKPEEKWTTITLAQIVAQDNPIDAIDYALGQHTGVVDENLLNGALIEYAKKNPFEAKTILLENQNHLNTMSVDALVESLLYNGHFSDAFELPYELVNSEMTQSAVNNLASKIHNFGDDTVSSFIESIKDTTLKSKALGSITNSMSAAGYPLEKLLEVLDIGSHNIPIAEKVFNYAYTLHTGYKDDPQALSNYIFRLRLHDEEFAGEIEKTIGYFN